MATVLAATHGWKMYTKEAELSNPVDPAVYFLTKAAMVSRLYLPALSPGVHRGTLPTAFLDPSATPWDHTCGMGTHPH